MRLFQFTWSNSYSAGYVIIKAESREKAQDILNTQYSSEKYSFYDEITEDVVFITTEQNLN